MSSTPSSPQRVVSIWEAVAIAAGAILLVAVGLVGLGVKALNNAFDPQRAKAIAQSLMEYKIPGGSRGLFGANIGGGKIAVITSTTAVPGDFSEAQLGNPSTVELVIAKVPEPSDPIEGEEAPPNEFFPGFSFSYQAAESFAVTQSRTEVRLFCGANVPVLIQEGWLTIAEQLEPLPAVKYKANAVLDADDYIAVISALGENAQENAAKVFDSLQCK